MRERSEKSQSAFIYPEANALRRLVDLISHRSGTVLSVMEKAGVTLAQVLLLNRIATLESPSITELAKGAPTSAAAVSQMVDRLVRQGLLRRVENALDRRRKSVSVSSKGVALLRALERARTVEFALGLSALSPALRAELGRLLERAVAELEGGRDSRESVGAA